MLNKPRLNEIVDTWCCNRKFDAKHETIIIFSFFLLRTHWNYVHRRMTNKNKYTAFLSNMFRLFISKKLPQIFFVLKKKFIKI